MVTVLTPPRALPIRLGPSVFLAGSIEMGVAEDWQSRFAEALGDLEATLLNPRRPDWDSSWVQSRENPHFVEQVTWELDGLDRATCVAMYFAPDTRAPVTLLELGLVARRQNVVVCCPEGYWRKGNVDIVCARHGVPTVDTFDDLVARVRVSLSAG